MTRSRSPRDPQDLRRVFHEHEGPAVDVAGLLSGVRRRIERRRARRRTAGIVAVGLVTALAAGIPIVASSIPDRDSSVAGGSSQPAPTASTSAPTEAQPLDGEDLRSTQFAFTLGERPADYTMEYATTAPGRQMLELSVLDSVDPPRTLSIELVDPGLSGLPAPVPSGETVTVESVSSGQLDVQVLTAGPDDEQTYSVGWLTDNDLWLTVASSGPSDLAQQEVLAVAAQVDLGSPHPLAFPFQLSYVTEGFSVAGAGGGVPVLSSSSVLNFHDLSPLFAEDEPALTITAVNMPGPPEDGVANTTVGPYQAQLTEGRFLDVYDVGGFLISFVVREDFVDRIDETELRQIAESIVVIPGAATDPSVWTAQPLG